MTLSNWLGSEKIKCTSSKKRLPQLLPLLMTRISGAQDSSYLFWSVAHHLMIYRDANYENHNANADVGIFSNEEGILTLEESVGRQGLGQKGVLQEMTKFKKEMFCFEGMMNKKSVFVHLDDDGSFYEEEMPCSRPDKMQEFRALLGQLRPERIERSSESGKDFLNKIREHLTKCVVRYSLASNC
jgi:hypothetical protein